jgi:hypothetical protein
MGTTMTNAALMLLGCLCCIVGLLHGAFKYKVIRSVARDVFNGGGVPVMDFVIVAPFWLAAGATVLLKRFALYPFPFFGLVLYGVIAAASYGVMELEYRRGAPERQRQLERIQAHEAAKRTGVEPRGPHEA